MPKLKITCTGRGFEVVRKIKRWDTVRLDEKAFGPYVGWAQSQPFHLDHKGPLFTHLIDS